jgi:hypothetical protein
MFRCVLLCCLIHAFILSSTRAFDIRVDAAIGNDKNDGIAKPVKTIARGLKLAQAGDTVHLTKAIYRESAVFLNRSGEQEKPIILDGHDSVLEGSEPLNVAQWEECAPGLFRVDNLLHLDDTILQRWFFLFNGKMNHMGRTSKGHRAEFKKPEELQHGEWSFLKDSSRTVAGSNQVFGSFYIKLKSGEKLSPANIAVPLRSAGLQFSGKNSHIIVRNVTATHVYNDGFNIHGTTRDCRFENIASIDCGDDGFSAHEDAECEIDGFVSIGNSTGLCDTAESRTHYKNVFIKNCLGYDVFFVSHGDHSIENAVVESSAAHAVSIGRDGILKDGVCKVRLKNFLVRRVGGGPQDFRISDGGHLQADHCTIENLTVQATKDCEVSFKQCFVTSEPKLPMLISKDARWSGEGNLYDLSSIQIDKTVFTAAKFAEFQKLLSSESGSVWSKEQASTTKVGADDKALQDLVKSKH